MKKTDPLGYLLCVEEGDVVEFNIIRENQMVYVEKIFRYVGSFKYTKYEDDVNKFQR